MGSTTFNPSSPRDDETVLFLFIAFAILIVLLLLLVLISCQTWMLWKMAKAVVEQDTQVTRRGGGNVGSAYGSSGAGKRSSVRASVRSVYAEDEERKLMSGGSGGGAAEGKRRTGVWGEGRWI